MTKALKQLIHQQVYHYKVVNWCIKIVLSQKYNRGVHYTCTPLLYFTQPLENKFLKNIR